MTRRRLGFALGSQTGRVDTAKLRRAFPSVLAALVILALTYHYAPVLVWLVRSWALSPQYSHGGIVALVAVLLIWSQRHRIVDLPRTTGWGGVGLIVVALMLRRWDLGASEPAMAAMGIPFLVLGLVWGFSGIAVAKKIAIPTLILLFGIPLPPMVFASVSMRVEYWAATAGAALLERVFSIPAMQEGVMIHLPRVSLEMGIQPAALQTLMTFTTFAAAYAYLLSGSVWKRWGVFVAGIVISVLASGVRVGLDGLVGHALGPYAMRSCHSCSGYIALFIAFGALIVFSRVVGCGDLRLPGSSSSE